MTTMCLKQKFFLELSTYRKHCQNNPQAYKTMLLCKQTVKTHTKCKAFS